MSHTWPFFNAQFATADDGTGADVVRLAQNDLDRHGSPYLSSSPKNSSLNVPNRESKRLSLQVQSKSFERTDTGNSTPVTAKGYRTFRPGDYIYNFELPIDSRLPETIGVDLGSVKYELEATVERAGAFRTNLHGTKEVTLIRAPAEGSLEQVEPIAISRNWEDQLHYDIVISGKSFPLGSKVPIAFKLTPLAKVQCHRIKVYVTENTEYFCSGKRVHRMEPTRKVLLFEKRADAPSVSKYQGSSMRILAGGGVPYDQRSRAAEGEEVDSMDMTNLLGRLESETNVGPTEMEFNVQLPGCQQFDEDSERPSKLHFDTTYSNIQVHHWIKVRYDFRQLSETLNANHIRSSCDFQSRIQLTQRNVDTLKFQLIHLSTFYHAVHHRRTLPCLRTLHPRAPGTTLMSLNVVVLVHRCDVFLPTTFPLLMRSMSLDRRIALRAI